MLQNFVGSVIHSDWAMEWGLRRGDIFIGEKGDIIWWYLNLKMVYIGSETSDVQLLENILLLPWFMYILLLCKNDTVGYSCILCVCACMCVRAHTYVCVFVCVVAMLSFVENRDFC